jgi:hypothetical protein
VRSLADIGDERAKRGRLLSGAAMIVVTGSNACLP